MRSADWDPPVVFSREHLRVLHPELLGKQHEGVHWSLALGGRALALCWADVLLSVCPLTRRVGEARTVGFCRFLKKATALGFSFSFCDI